VRKKVGRKKEQGTGRKKEKEKKEGQRKKEAGGQEHEADEHIGQDTEEWGGCRGKNGGGGG